MVGNGYKLLIMITLEEFTRLIETEFEDVQPDSISPDMHYREILDFSSMNALVLIALIDNEFDILLNGQDLKSTTTIRELYTLVENRINT